MCVCVCVCVCVSLHCMNEIVTLFSLTLFIHNFYTWLVLMFCQGEPKRLGTMVPLHTSLKPVLNWANVCSPEHTSDTSTNYDSFLN